MKPDFFFFFVTLPSATKYKRKLIGLETERYRSLKKDPGLYYLVVADHAMLSVFSQERKKRNIFAQRKGPFIFIEGVKKGSTQCAHTAFTQQRDSMRYEDKQKERTVKVLLSAQ